MIHIKRLNEMMLEKRGVVSGEDSWSSLVDDVVKKLRGRKYEYGSMLTFTKNCPPWMSKLDVVIDRQDSQYLGGYDDEDSKLEAGKLGVVVIVAPENLKVVKTTLEHELQHAYDDWIARTKRGGKSFLGQTYSIEVGSESPEYDNIIPYDIIEHPSKVNFNHVFFLMNYSTYWFEESEVNAHLREFSMYINAIASEGEVWDFNDIYDNEDMGTLPLIGLALIHYFIDNIDKYNVDWKFVMGAINVNWTTRYLGHKFKGETKEDVVKVFEEILKRKGSKAQKRYVRVIKDSGVRVINLPNWLSL